MPDAAAASESAAGFTSPRTTRRDLLIGLMIALLCLLVYNANGRAISAGDALPARYQPFAIWKYSTVLLDPIETITSQGRERPTSWQKASPNTAFWIVPTRRGHLVSLYSVALPVLISPLYLPAVLCVNEFGWTDEHIDRTARIMEKLTASLLAALSASLLYLALRRRATEPTALLLTAAYAFGTTTWVISSQALWQHGMGELLIAGLLLLLSGRGTPPGAVMAGLLCGLIAANRPADAVLAAALGLYGLFWAQRRAVLFAAAALAPVLTVLFYNLAVVGALTGAYQLVGRTAFFQHNLFAGLAGLLFSPTRGLFVFSPFLLFLFFPRRHPWESRTDRLLAFAMIAGVVVQLLLYSKIDWRGGIAWGPRFLTDLLPLLLWLLAPAVATLRRSGRICFALTVVFAIAIEAIGAFTYTGVSDLPIYAVTDGPSKLRAAWDWRNAAFIASSSHGFAAAELTRRMRGAIDAIAVHDQVVDTITAGDDVVARGWAVAGRATPLQVALSIDGVEIAATRKFYDRPDVRGVLPGVQETGWRMPLHTAGLSSGNHRLTLYMWASENGERYFLGGSTLTVKAADSSGAASTADSPATAWNVNESFRTAATRIREHQQESGYWLTAFTRSASSSNPAKR